MTDNESAADKAPWITYRPELKVLDCTVRDGGLINAHQFEDSFVRAVYDTCLAAGIDSMEIGYKNSERLFPREQFGHRLVRVACGRKVRAHTVLELVHQRQVLDLI